MERMTAAERPASAESPAPSREDTLVPPIAVWEVMAQFDRRHWIVLGGIAAAGAMLTFALGRDLHRSPLVQAVILAAMAFSAARVGWMWLRGRSRRARLRESMLSRVEQYGGGVYGTGAGITLLVLSAASLRTEWAQANGPIDFLRGMSMEWFMGFSSESIRNAVSAGIWPLHWYGEHGFVAALAVGAAAWAGDALADRWRRRDPLSAEAVEGTEVGAEVRPHPA